eukprot:gene47972-64365_t
MLFNSYPFIFIFFPLVLIGFFLIGARSPRAAAGFLALASLFFYGWWSVKALPLLLGSICINYWFGLRLTPSPSREDKHRKALLIIALVVNLGVLAVFKYANFFLGALMQFPAGKMSDRTDRRYVLAGLSALAAVA